MAIILTWIRNTHRFAYGRNGRYNYKHTNKIKWILCNVLYRVANGVMDKCLNIYKMFDLYPKPLEGNNDIVVSLTSFPKRIDSVWKVIDSMFRQTMRPGRIYLYLTEEEFPQGRKELPKRLLSYERLGLEICFRQYNLMPHNKYFYALQEHKDKCVITIDDDMYYHDDLVERLWKLHQQHGDSVCSNTINVIPDDNTLFYNYDSWMRPTRSLFPSLWNVALGYNGVLYPKGIFKRMDVFNIEYIKSLSLKADDLWLKAHELLEDVSVVSGNYYCSGIQLSGTQVISLMSTNVGENQNNQQWNELCNHFDITPTYIHNHDIQFQNRLGDSARRV